MEGKEVRFGADGTVSGSVNGMHDSLAPLSGGIAMVNMLVSAICGIGCGLQQFIVFCCWVCSWPG